MSKEQLSGKQLPVEGSRESFEETITVVRRQSKDLIALQASIHELMQLLGEQTKETVVCRLNLQFPKLHVLVSMHGEGTPDKWRPKVYVWGPNREELVRRDNRVIGWYHRFERVDVNIDPEALLGECARLSREFHVDIEPVFSQLDPMNALPSNTNDLRAIYGDAAVVASGEVWYKGWDIPDIFAIVKLDSTFKLYLSTSGHSSSFSEIIEAKDGRAGLDKFFDFIEQDEDHMALRVKWYERIANTWGSLAADVR